MTIRELLAELTRLEERLNGRRAAANYQVNAEIARLERQMGAIRAQLRQRRSIQPDSVPLTNANEADQIEQSIPVDFAPDEEYPHQQQDDRH